MEDLKRVLEYLFTPSAPVITVGLLVVFLVPVLVHLYVVRRTPYTTLPSILLAGPSGGGKTSLTTLLERGDRAAATHTSQITHSVELTVPSEDNSKNNATAKSTFRDAAREDAPGSHKKFLLVDTPGHGKLRNQHAMTRLGTGTTTSVGGGGGGEIDGNQNIKGIVFVVDAAALEAESLADAAAYLYDMLLSLQKRTGAGKTSRTPPAIPVLVAANKLDLFTALPASLVKANLEAELGRIRLSRSRGLLDSGVGMDDVGSEEQDGWLGEYGSEKFSFAQMREFDVDVDVVGGSVLEGNVDRWWDWISDRI